MFRVLKDYFDPDYTMNPGGTIGLDLKPEEKEAPKRAERLPLSLIFHWPGEPRFSGLFGSFSRAAEDRPEARNARRQAYAQRRRADACQGQRRRIRRFLSPPLFFDILSKKNQICC